MKVIRDGLDQSCGGLLTNFTCDVVWEGDAYLDSMQISDLE